jgi:hypothetical protein
MTFQFFKRWEWFFEYRAAKVKMDNPRGKVEYTTGFYDYVPKREILEKRLKGNLIGRKSALTKFMNKLKKAESKAKAVSLFGIEQDPNYDKVMEKKKYLERRLEQAQEQLQDFYDGKLEIPKTAHECLIYRPKKEQLIS